MRQPGLDQEREERSGSHSPEQPDVEHDDRGHRLKGTIHDSAARERPLRIDARVAKRRAVDARGFRFAPREDVGRGRHEYAFGDTRQDRRVVPEPLDTKTRTRGHFVEMRSAGERIQMVRRPQAIDSEIGEPGALDRARDACDGGEHRRKRRQLHHVRIDEQRAARRQHAIDFPKHRVKALRREVLDDVDCVGLRHAAVCKRQLAKLADNEIEARARFRGEERSRIDADEVRARVEIPDREAPAPAAQIEHHVARTGLQKLPQHVVAHRGGQQRRRHGLVASIGVKTVFDKLRRLVVHARRAKDEVVGAFPR